MQVKCFHLIPLENLYTEKHVFLILTEVPVDSKAQGKDIAVIMYTSGATGIPKGMLALIPRLHFNELKM